MTGPDRIWATEDKENFGEDRFHSTFPMKGLTEYVRRDPAVLAALPEVQAMIAAAYEVAARETLTLVLASVTDIASTLLSVGDAEGANGLCVMIKTLEQHADTIPKSVSGALTPAAAAAALAARDAAMRAEGLREAATLLREQGYGTAPKQILARAAEIERDARITCAGQQSPIE